MKLIFLGMGAVVLATGLLWLVRNSRAFTASAPYQSVRIEGAFELRDYPALTLAVTPMATEGDSSAFRRLFGFITGQNAKTEKIPMTTPVWIDPAPGGQTMSFVMPESIVRQGVPTPSASGGVHVVQTEPARYAVMRFKGASNAKNQSDAVAQLQAWLDKQGIVAESGPIFAYYDPPWTLLFLRRNEVMVRVPRGTP